MSLQNRVAPDGSLHAVAARGMFTGNRGILHDPQSRTLRGRRWTTKSWIVCACEWKGVRRDVWGWNARGGGAGWSELFFLDEVTALAAGHRPCFYCRRAAAQAFASAFDAGNALAAPTALQRDAILHRSRRLSGTGVRIPLDQSELRELPDGAMIESGGEFLAICGGRALPWRFSGYAAPTPIPRQALLVTPGPTLAALRSGFRPVWHSSAQT